MIRVQDGLITIPTTHVIPLAIWIGKSEWHTYKRDDVDKPKSTEYYNPIVGKCCQDVRYTVRINLGPREEGILQREGLHTMRVSLEMTWCLH